MARAGLKLLDFFSQGCRLRCSLAWDWGPAHAKILIYPIHSIELTHYLVSCVADRDFPSFSYGYYSQSFINCNFYKASEDDSLINSLSQQIN